VRILSAQVEIRVGEKDGAELIRSIYADLVNLPDPLKLGLTVRIFNYDSVTLYMRVDGYNAAWTFTSNDLGAVGSGSDIYRNLDQFGSRAKPAAETLESITVRLRAYTDAGYSDLKWTYERVVNVVLIKSDDGSWTEDVLNNFDDGTVQGWAATLESGGSVAVLASSTFALSPPYSLQCYTSGTGVGQTPRGRFWKSFTTPNKPTVYAIFDMRSVAGVDCRIKYRYNSQDGTILVYIGRPADTSSTTYIPVNKWTRVVVPLPGNTTLELRIVQHGYLIQYTTGPNHNVYLDDFRIISK